MNHKYMTKQIADLIGIHPNTVRFYEEIGFITPPARHINGYREYTDIQLTECKIIRAALKAEVIQNGLRKKVVEIIRLCANLDIDSAVTNTELYISMLKNEINKAHSAVTYVEHILNKTYAEEASSYTRTEVAKLMGITYDTLRNWELNGLVKPSSLNNRQVIYTASDVEKIQIVRTLRCANYSLSSILRLMRKLTENTNHSLEQILDTPEATEDIVSVCDRLVTSLEKASEDAKRLLKLIYQLKNITTLQ